MKQKINGSVNGGESIKTPHNRRNLYIWSQGVERRFQYNGIEFHEWVSCLGEDLNLILLKSMYWQSHRHGTTNLDYLLKSEMSALLQDDIYDYGDFVWTDFESEGSLDSLTPLNVAELLYMAHMAKPLYSPFLSAINNRFLYCAHDDGWSTRLYCRDPNDFYKILCHIIPLRSKSNVPLDGDCLNVLVPLLGEGLLFGFQHMKLTPNATVPIYVVGRFHDMDAIPDVGDTIKGYLRLNERWTVTFV